MTTTTCRICHEQHEIGDYCPDPQTRVAGYAAAAKDAIREAKARRDGLTCSHGGTIGKCRDCEAGS